MVSFMDEAIVPAIVNLECRLGPRGLHFFGCI